MVPRWRAISSFSARLKATSADCSVASLMVSCPKRGFFRAPKHRQSVLLLDKGPLNDIVTHFADMWGNLEAEAVEHS